MLKQLVYNNQYFSEKQINTILKICNRKLKDVDDILDESKVINYIIISIFCIYLG